MLEAFLGRLIMVVYDDFQRCLVVIFWGGSCWLLGLLSDDVQMVLEWFLRVVLRPFEGLSEE